MFETLFKHLLAYRERWQGPVMGEALAKGILWHNVMETHYKVLKQIQDELRAEPKLRFTDKAKLARIADAVRPFLADPKSGKQSEHQELIEWMYINYVAMWGLDEEWEVVAVEHAPVVRLLRPDGSPSNFSLKLKIDLVVRDRSTRQLWIVDHKSGKDLPTDKMLELADQFGLYAWALRQLGRPVFGELHNATRTQRNKDPKTQPPEKLNKRTPMYRTDAELNTIATEALATFELAYSLPLGAAPRSPNEDTCRWRCDFTEICLLGRKGLDVHGLMGEYGYVQDFTRH